MIYKKLDDAKQIRIDYAKDILDVVNIKYKSDVFFDEILEKLKEKGVCQSKDLLYLNEKEIDRLQANVRSEINKLEKKRDDIESESNELNSFLDEEDSNFEKIEEELKYKNETRPIRVEIHSTLPLRINRYSAEQIAKTDIKKTLLFFRPKEVISTVVLKYRPIYKIFYNLYDIKNNFKRMHCYIDSVTGEFIHFKNSKFKESIGFNKIDKLKEEDLEVLYLLQKQQTLFSLSKELEKDEKYIETTYIHKFQKLDIIDSWEKNNREIFKLSKNFEISFNASHKLLSSLDELSLKKEETEFIESTNYSTSQIQENLKKLWGELEFISLEEIYWPIWYVSLLNKNNEERILKIDGIIGEILK
jgi:hypothetical protein